MEVSNALQILRYIARYARRVLEIFALAKWAEDVSSGVNAWNKNIILLGDMNIPNVSHDEATFQALRAFGWMTLNYGADSDATMPDDPAMMSRVKSSNIADGRTYDQIALSPYGDFGKQCLNFGVFDFDNVIFRNENRLRDQISPVGAGTAYEESLFDAYVKFYISDHRPLWMELRTA